MNKGFLVPFDSILSIVPDDGKKCIESIDYIVNINSENIEGSFVSLERYVKESKDMNTAIKQIYSIINECVIIRPTNIKHYIELIKLINKEFGRLPDFKFFSSSCNIFAASLVNSNIYNEKDALGYLENYNEFVGNQLTDLYPINTLEYIIKNDDLDSLIKWVSQPGYDDKIQLNAFKYIQCKFSPKMQCSIIEMCAFYGSVKCFSFVSLNCNKMPSDIASFAVAGRNKVIIHKLENMNISFDRCLKVAMDYHSNDIFDWLLKNFECESICLNEAINSSNYRVVLYLIENGADLNSPDYIQRVPLHYACGKCCSWLVDCLVSKGAKLNVRDKYNMLPIDISKLNNDKESIKILNHK